MLTFYFIRHALKEAVPFDPPLTAIGIRQAEATAELFRNMDVSAIIASPKERTRRTAEIIATAHLLSVELDSRLQERLEWESTVWLDDFMKEWKKTELDRYYVPKEGLSSFANGKQVKQVLDELFNKYMKGNILLVTHGGTIGDLLRHLFGEKAISHIIDPVTKSPHISIAECSVTVLQKRGNKYKLLQINDSSHLEVI